MSRLTARQLFERVIIPNIDVSAQITEVPLNFPDQIQFKLCENKWIRRNLIFTDVRDVTWSVTSVDTETGLITVIPPGPGATLNPGEYIQLQRPVLRVGTVRTVNGEMQLEERSTTQITFPIIWLLEGIKGRGFDKFDNRGMEADFVWYALDETSISDYLNADRHNFGVVPMTALAESVIDSIERKPGLALTSGYSFSEFPIFGREDKKGIESYIIGKNLAGVEYRANVSATKTVCDC